MYIIITFLNSRVYRIRQNVWSGQIASYIFVLMYVLILLADVLILLTDLLPIYYRFTTDPFTCAWCIKFFFHKMDVFATAFFFFAGELFTVLTKEYDLFQLINWLMQLDVGGCCVG